MALTLLHYGCNSSRNIHTQVTRVHVQLLIYNISVLLPHSISFFIPSAKNEIGNVAYKSFIILIILKTAPSLVSDSNMAIWLLSSFSKQLCVTEHCLGKESHFGRARFFFLPKD